ncbi:hypothetical protein KNO15_10125 [Leifsonia shinshuensis]|uniref:hypothetical protein n=1 Tax=Leifsonia shinshuensis TaxID=150026 RepID=UPI001F50DC65|nr:hypothetical protein [Leifsonia shinshuensis]MCI0157051.1 hypothetical protein [Leifsonia shinshuensis]
MRLGEALRESRRDVASGAGRTVAFALVYTALVGGIVLASALSAAAAVRDARAYVASGAAVFVMKATGGIDGRSCDAMSMLANVVASGALREETEGVASARLPQTQISLFAASDGFPDLLRGAGDARGGGLGLSQEVADTLGLEPGDPMATTRGTTKVASVFDYPDDGRDPLLAFAAIGQAPHSKAAFDQCWVLIWPHDEKAVAALGRTVLPGATGSGERPTLVQLNQTRGSQFTAATMFDHSVAGPLAAAAGGLLGVAFVIRRRLSLASDRHVGVARAAQVVSQTAQVLLWVAVGAVASLALVLVAVRLPVEDRMPIVQQSAVLLVAGGGAALAASALTVCAIRDSALFRYFKNR